MFAPPAAPPAAGSNGRPPSTGAGATGTAAPPLGCRCAVVSASPSGVARSLLRSRCRLQTEPACSPYQ